MKEGWWKWSRIALYNIVGWGVPFLLMLIPAAAGKLGFEPGSTLYVPQFPNVMANGYFQLLCYIHRQLRLEFDFLFHSCGYLSSCGVCPLRSLIDEANHRGD